MSNNRTFFKNVVAGKMTLGDIFEQVSRKHSEEETARVLISGTSLTTPSEPEMLAGWQKPFLFARFFAGYAGFLLLAYLMFTLLEDYRVYYLLLVGIPVLVPVTLLLLVWEMNVPRNISLYEVVRITALGGLLSVPAALIGFFFSGVSSATWAGLVEEPAKLLVIYMILRRKNYKYTLNGVLIGAAVGTGFALMESLFYVIDGMGQGVLLGLALCAEQVATLTDVMEAFGMVWQFGLSNGLMVAIARAVTAISGHGVFAALYGGALVKSKGEEDLQITHLLNMEFLFFFATSILLHALHNNGLDLGLPVLLNGLLPSEYIIIAAIAIALLLNMLKIGVNQAIAISVAYHDGHVTQAVNYEVLQQMSAADNNAEMSAYVTAPVKRQEQMHIYRVEFIAGPLANRKFRLLENQSITMGRDGSRNDITLHKCNKVSGIHCRISVLGDHAMVTDLNSTNGTYLDGQKLVPNQVVPVWNGSTIWLGSRDCAFRIFIQ